MEEEFLKLIEKYEQSPVVCQMDRYIQHGTTTTLSHCRNVAWVSYRLNRRLSLNANEKELVEAAILHDLYLYDWHHHKREGRMHGFSHPAIACRNAVKYFDIPFSEQKAILSHMWPLNITEIPSSREAVILCVADKYCALMETIRLNEMFGLK